MKPPSPAPKAYSAIEIVRLAWLAIFISVFSFLSYNRQGSLLLYGDAVAHINIARRVFDSQTPGLLQLGTVWLPLPHLLILPFVVSTRMWRTGVGGSIPSMSAYVLAVVGMFRLARVALAFDAETNRSPLTAWAIAILYAANPNLIYMQATAMGEPLYLAFFIWALVFFSEFVQGNSAALTGCGLCLAGACFTRYDGWFLSAILVGVVPFREFLRPRQDEKISSGRTNIATRPAISRFILLAAAAPVLWLAYNAAVYRNPLEFANGPYSAKSIEQKTATVNPGRGNLLAAGSYFLKAAELDVAESTWLGRLWLALALLGTFAAARSGRAKALLLLWAPLPFYALSVAYGSIPIFVPTWWPFSLYNVRYGLQLLPAFAVFVPMGISFLAESITRLPSIDASWRRWTAVSTIPASLLLATASYGAIWRAGPICFQEADHNMRGPVALDHQLSEWIKSMPPGSTLLMYLGEHSGAVQQAGVPLRRTINEGNHRVWKRPADPEGLWERALADPASYADYAVGFEGDPVWKAAHDHHLKALVEIHTTGQPPAVIFQCRTPSARQATQ